MKKELLVADITAWEDIMPELLSSSMGSKCWCLHGDLGAGKTSLVQALMRHLGSSDVVSSPTYAILNHYTTPRVDLATIYHLDLYRLEDLDDVINLGWQDVEYAADLMLIEWPAVASPLLPEDAFHVKISTNGSGRKVVLL